MPFESKEPDLVWSIFVRIDQVVVDYLLCLDVLVMLK